MSSLSLPPPPDGATAVRQESYAHSVYPLVLAGRQWTAIQTTTACSVCAVFDLLVAGRLPQQGFVRQEDIRLDESSPTALAAPTRRI
jgi:saccharopine dehydrogenase-like NADP-dependent oxidoreductase